MVLDKLADQFLKLCLANRPPGFGPGPIKAHTWWDSDKAPPKGIWEWDGKREVYEVMRYVNRDFGYIGAIELNNARAVFPNRESALHWINTRTPENIKTMFPDGLDDELAEMFKIVKLHKTKSPPSY